MDYNTDREHLIIREYGRHVQRLINYAKTIENKEERQKVVDNIIVLMGQLSPHLKNVADFKHLLWDHLFMIGGFDMDIDSPYEKPSPEITIPNPADLPYPKQQIRFKHYGKNVEFMIEKARQYDDLEKRKGLTEVIVNFMKMAYRNWSEEAVSDELIKQDLQTLSNGTLVVDDEMNIEAFVKSTPTAAPIAKGKSNQKRSFNNKGKRPGGNGNTNGNSSGGGNGNSSNGNNNNRKRFR
jgi:hypothetical protein